MFGKPLGIKLHGSFEWPASPRQGRARAQMGQYLRGRPFAFAGSREPCAIALVLIRPLARQQFVD